ncbi:hypothetical protein AB07_2216 [Citrobacter freundii]|nr:hypothetical protein AB07_2216 [Citrobacter freundii]
MLSWQTEANLQLTEISLTDHASFKHSLNIVSWLPIIFFLNFSKI